MKSRKKGFQIRFKGLMGILRDPSISAPAKALLSNLLFYAGTDNSAFPSEETLAKDMGVSSRTIRNWITELREKGILDWKRRGFNMSHLYSFSKEVYFLSEQKKNSVDSGSELPIQSGSRLPDKEIIESNQINSSQLEELTHKFKKLRKMPLTAIDIGRLNMLAIKYGCSRVDQSIDEAKKKHYSHYEVGLLEKILVDWSVVGAPLIKPKFTPCRQGNCNEVGYIDGKDIDGKYTIMGACKCKEDFDSAQKK